MTECVHDVFVHTKVYECERKQIWCIVCIYVWASASRVCVLWIMYRYVSVRCVTACTLTRSANFVWLAHIRLIFVKCAWCSSHHLPRSHITVKTFRKCWFSPHILYPLTRRTCFVHTCVFVRFITVARQANAVKMICPQSRQTTSRWTPHWLNEKSVIIHKLTPFALPPVWSVIPPPHHRVGAAATSIPFRDRYVYSHPRVNTATSTATLAQCHHIPPWHECMCDQPMTR